MVAKVGKYAGIFLGGIAQEPWKPPANLSITMIPQIPKLIFFYTSIDQNSVFFAVASLTLWTLEAAFGSRRSSWG